MAELSPVELEVFRHALAGVADEMGVALRRASYSPNIKERADCSAAVFDAAGEMVAQAEHIPVHLGAMPESVRAVLDTCGELRPGDQVCVNDPYLGGTHLPDLTIVSAVGYGDRLLGYVANRAHHADVGGAAPELLEEVLVGLQDAHSGVQVGHAHAGLLEQGPEGVAVGLLGFLYHCCRSARRTHGAARRHSGSTIPLSLREGRFPSMRRWNSQNSPMRSHYGAKTNQVNSGSALRLRLR